MKEFLPEIDELIAKVLTDEANADEKADFEKWLNESPENQRYFDDLTRIWSDSAEVFDNTDVAQSVNTDVAWNKVQKRISIAKPLKVSWLRSNALKVAAAVAVLIAAVFYFKDSAPPQYNYVAEAKVTTDTLTDGSIITLNKKSSVTTVFSKKERRVRMSGEAFFAVAPNKEKPFVIEVKTVEVKVVGTAFNVDNISKDGKVIITVQEGIVEVKGKNDIKTLLKGDKVIYDLATDTFEATEDVTKKMMEYKKGKLEFDGNTLKDVVNQINKFYGQNIEIASTGIENCQVNTVYAGEDVEQWFNEVVKELINIDIEKQGDRLILRGQGCD